MYVFDAPPQASVAVQGTDNRFPVRRIFCVGRNYEAHAREMGNDPTREPPFFFTKPADAVIDAPCEMPYPSLTENLHHEIELVIAIGKGGSDIEVADVDAHIWGAAVGLDMTRRDLQGEAKKMGRPWDWGKAFDHSAPMGAIKPIAQVPSLEQGRIWLAVNGEVRQDARHHTIYDVAPFRGVAHCAAPWGRNGAAQQKVLGGALDWSGESQVSV